MVSTWASTALNIPELVDMIMAFLHHDKCTLVLCARVSKLWGHAAVRFLWDEVNAYEVAHALIGSTDHRRQHCLQQIRQLDFSPPKSGAHLQSRAVLHRFFFGLELPKLCKLKTTGWYASNEDAVISQYFNNRLTDLYLSCTTHPDTFLDHLQAHCPQLVSLAIGRGDQRRFTDSAFFKFLIDSPTLQKLRLLDQMQYVCTERVFCHLAARPMLTDLEFHFIPLSYVKSAEKSTEVPFKQLRYFKCGIDNGLTRIIPYLEKLEAIHITTGGVGTPLFLSLLHTLRSISIHYVGYSTFAPEELIAIAEGCPGLAEFQLSEERAFMLLGLLTDKDITTFTSMVPQLTSFILRADNGLTVTSWRSFGKNCRMLQKLAICNTDMAVKFQRLTRAKICLFPELQEMQLSCLQLDNETTPETFVALLQRHAPKLKVCILRDTGVITRAFVEKCRIAWPGNCPIRMKDSLFT